jgi:hypothetical protein
VSWAVSTVIYRWKGYDNLPASSPKGGIRATEA